MKLPLLKPATPMLGIDFGSSYTRIWTPDDGIVLSEPTSIAVDKRTQKVIAVGHEAEAMTGRVGDIFTVHHPVQRGRLYDMDIAQALLKVFLERVLKSNYFFRPVMMVSVAGSSTHAEVEAMSELMYLVGAREVYTISQPLAAAIGAGVPIADASGSFIVQLGSGVVEGAVISLASLVKTEASIVAGSEIDRRIQMVLKEKLALNVSLETAERLKKKIGSIDAHLVKEMFTTGQDVAEFSPKEVTITSSMILPTLMTVVAKYEVVLKKLLSEIPPELTVDVIDKGILLSGGMAQLGGLDQYLVTQLGIPVSVVEEPDKTVIKGISTALEHLDLFKESLGYRT